MYVNIGATFPVTQFPKASEILIYPATTPAIKPVRAIGQQLLQTAAQFFAAKQAAKAQAKQPTDIQYTDYAVPSSQVSAKKWVLPVVLGGLLFLVLIALRK